VWKNEGMQCFWRGVAAALVVGPRSQAIHAYCSGNRILSLGTEVRSSTTLVV
jgi:hypothetical protein